VDIPNYIQYYVDLEGDEEGDPQDKVMGNSSEGEDSIKKMLFFVTLV